MAQSGKTFRIFVSSTFNDLKVERNALQERVFPKLRELCMQYGCRFQAIDLRWGVSEEAGLDQQTMKICLEEIARCQEITPRPNFIVLLGDRYGWRPLPYEIHAVEFEEILKNVKNTDDRELLTHWYRRDDNAVPPVYCLQPRTGEFMDSDSWGPVERKIRSILLKAIADLKLGPVDNLKYTTSATEQEIIQGVIRIPDAGEHVFCFSREFVVTQKDGSHTSVRNTPLNHSFNDFVDLDLKDNLDSDAHDCLHSLKRRLGDLLGDNMYHYEVEWNGGTVANEYLKQLCDDALRSLSQIIIKEASALKEIDTLDMEIREHEAFGKERARFFIGRTGILQSIENYLKGEDTYPLVIFGDPGSGKTALVARAAQNAGEIRPGAEVISRFIGATPSSADGRSLLESLCRQISRLYGEDESTISTDYRDLIQEFPKQLALATKEKPLILFLDALDQLSDTNNARDLSWLPPKLSANVHLVVSSLPGECLSALKSKLPAETDNLTKLEPMPLSEGKELLNLWLKDARRTLQEHQRDEVLAKFQECSSPLYLKLAFEEARRWESYSEKVELSDDIPGVIGDLLGRLSSESNHGEKMISRSLGYLAAAKNGLSEDEMLDVLSLDPDVMADFQRRSPKSPDVKKLPVVVWSRLHLDLKPYLTERAADGTSLMTFYHPTTFGQAVIAKYLAGDEKRERHYGLAQYFGSQQLRVDKDVNLRKVDEYPYQLQHAEQWEALASAISDLDLFDYAFRHNREYEFMEYWRSLEGRFAPGSCYQATVEAKVRLEGETNHIARLSNDIGIFLSEMGLYPSALPFCQRALAIEERTLGHDHPDVAKSLSNLASIYDKQGNYDEALPLFKRALAIEERTLGRDHPDVATTCGNLASFYNKQRNYDEALPLSKRALAIQERTLGHDHPDVAISLNNLGWLYLDYGKYGEALPLFKRALAILERTVGPNHHRFATTLNNLADLYNKQGNYDEALPLYQRALEIKERTVGPNHPDVAWNLANLADLYNKRDNLDEALPLYQRALAIEERTLGHDHPDVASSLSNLASIYYKQGNYAEALPFYQRALAIQERTVGPDHPDVATTLNNLARVYDMQGNYAEALPLFKRAMSIAEASLGPHHPNTEMLRKGLRLCQDAMY
jgi:tetratricopeptide (TPR) repeat protein